MQLDSPKRQIDDEVASAAMGISFAFLVAAPRESKGARRPGRRLICEGVDGIGAWKSREEQGVATLVSVVAAQRAG